jgi:predicted dehydrogenase
MTRAGADVVATVDPLNPAATHTDLVQIPVDDYDGACVCTPDYTKPALLSYLLTHRKHLLVEKPLICEDQAELDALGRLAHESGVACYTAYNHRFEPHLVAIKEIIESGTLGNLHLVRAFYGNGTARDVRASPWRDRGLGVLSDLGSHLLDLCLFLFGRRIGEPRLWGYHNFENAAADHFLFGFEGEPVIELEGTMLWWRNHFTLDVVGERGSAHVSGLCKWGPTTLSVRTRVLPSGKPPERAITLEQRDPTWDAEYEYFKALCRSGGTNIDNDCWINAALNTLRDHRDAVIGAQARLS